MVTATSSLPTVHASTTALGAVGVLPIPGVGCGAVSFRAYRAWMERGGCGAGDHRLNHSGSQGLFEKLKSQRGLTERSEPDS